MRVAKDVHAVVFLSVHEAATRVFSCCRVLPGVRSRGKRAENVHNPFHISDEKNNFRGHFGFFYFSGILV